MQQDELLNYYQQELIFMRQLGAEFAAQHPKIAGRLGLNAVNAQDPHVERLIEAFALGNARIRHKLDDEFSIISDALINVLHPHYLAPQPSFSIAQFTVDPTKLLSTKMIPADTLLVSASQYGAPCHFTTRYPVELSPITVEAAMLQSKPWQAPNIAGGSQAVAVLRLSLRCLQAQLSIRSLNIDALSFFINAPSRHAHKLYELLFNHTLGIAIATAADDPLPLILNKNSLQAPGFAESAGLLPYSKRTSMGQRLLTDYFALPEKFFFFKISDLLAPLQQKDYTAGAALELFFYLNKTDIALADHLNADYFALSCTPIINLFHATAAPFNLCHTRTEYPLIANAQRVSTEQEIYAVKGVVAIDEQGVEFEYQPFYGSKHAQQQQRYYQTARRYPWQVNSSYTRGQQTDLFISFTDLNFKANSRAANLLITAELLCTNRDKPIQLPCGTTESILQFAEYNQDTVQAIHCLLPFTPVRRPFLRPGARWRYVTHLALNWLSLTDAEYGIETLRSLLQLHDSNESENPTYLTALLSLRITPATTRNPHQRGIVFWQGNRIDLQVDAEQFSDDSLYLFGCVLEQFFALYTALNSYTELVINDQHNTELFHWPPRAGNQALL